MVKSYAPMPICRREILRYSGCRDDGGELADLIDECIAEAEGALTYKVCRCELTDSELNKLREKYDTAARHLQGCERAIVFAATVGVGIDRLIARYSRLSPVKALVFQALGAERVEALCDEFCADIEKEYRCFTRERFSPGYGDLPLEYQREIFALLDCERKIGLTLNASLMMSPSKSVTAVVGLCSEANRAENKCALCNLRGCEFRGAV